MITDVNGIEIKENTRVKRVKCDFGTSSLKLPVGTKGVFKNGVIVWDNGIQSNILEKKRYKLLKIIEN